MLNKDKVFYVALAISVAGGVAAFAYDIVRTNREREEKDREWAAYVAKRSAEKAVEAKRQEERREFMHNFDKACRLNGGVAVPTLFWELECIDKDVTVPITRAP